MTSKIRVLTEHTINKIAAGEVIENPSSVVKELVENSLDAGATDICVEIKGGGRQLIRITDNGSGMNADDALLSLERHATSKLREVEDLQTIYTMGFRGEAIPSIASISKFTLLTCPNPPSSPDQLGTLVLVDGGKILRCSPAACTPGTLIEVKTLFFNVPVRKKFQKSPAYDTNEIQKMLTSLALGHPKIKFQLISNEQNLLLTPAIKSESIQELIGERISAVLGIHYFEELRPLEVVKDEYCIRGFVGIPIAHRQNRTGQYLFINKRAVYSPFISYAVREGYGPSIPPNRHPIFVLHLTLPGEWVDVNVHPQKKEVRLRQENVFKDTISRAVEKTLQEINSHSIDKSPSISFNLPEREYHSPADFFDPLPNYTPSTFPFTPLPFQKLEKEVPPAPPICLQRKKEQENMTTPLFKPLPSPKTIPKAIATLPRYILVEASSLESSRGEGLCLIDQHGAHSRIIFEKLVQSKTKSEGQLAVSSQLLLIPYTFDTSPTETEILLRQLPLLNAMGISIKEFGSHSFNIDALPQCFGNIDIKEFLNNLLQSTDELNSQSIEIASARKIALSASRAAISKNVRLSLDEAQGLLRQLIQCQTPFKCPLGHSTLAHITLDEVSRYFK